MHDKPRGTTFQRREHLRECVAEALANPHLKVKSTYDKRFYAAFYCNNIKVE